MGGAVTVVVLGGGVGGVTAALELRKRLPHPHRVVLLERERQYLFPPSLLWLMVGLRRPEALRRPLARLEGKGIEVRFGEVERIDPGARQVSLEGEVIAADHLVVSLGAELATESVPGLVQAGHSFYTLDGAHGFHAAIDSLRSGRVVVLTAAPAYKCPGAPYEAALLVDHFLRRRGLRERVRVDVYAAEQAPMGVAGPEVSDGVKQLLAARGIGYHPDHQVTRADASSRRLEFANGSGAEFDVLAWVPPHRAPRVVRESGLAGESGWVSVDRFTLQTRFPGVCAIGDVVSIPLSLGKPLPKAGVFAGGQAKVVARNIALAVTGAGVPARFDGHGECFIETGGGRAAFGAGDFYAEPRPQVRLRPPSWRWHLAKLLLEKWWLRVKL